MNMIKKTKQILKYSDYELLSIFLNIIIIFLNPYILLNTFTNAPYWLIFLGIPFGLYSIYHTLNECKKSKDFSINLNIGQVLGITIYSLEVNTLCIPFICQLVILLFLKWRSSRDVARMDLREK